MNITFIIAFTAGLLSFFSPCVIPLLPIYLGYLSGASVSAFGRNSTRRTYIRTVAVHTGLFLAGFTVVFTALGMGSSFIGSFLILHKINLLRIGGLFIFVFGLSVLGVFRRIFGAGVGFRLEMPGAVYRLRLVNPFFLGVVFALTWSPCVGPTLGAILTLAATTGNGAGGMMLLLVYAAGIAVPFVAVALTFGSSYPFLRRLRGHIAGLNMIAGLLLILVGISMVLGWYGGLTPWTAEVLEKLGVARYIFPRI
ncbi:cytochrome c biogenesis protein CcdA [Patescibacteria group bacterium]|nr:cytochrome c biogenesis protein CcdA [Patescibacteria group bacterium]